MAQLLDTGRIGKQALNALNHTRGINTMMLDALSHTGTLVSNASVRRVLYKQIYFTGIQALFPISVIGAMIGIVIITQVTNIVGVNPLLIGKILVWTVIRELGPLFSAIIIIARSSTAIASELGSMKANKEIDSLKVVGIDPLLYLIVPRVAGTAFCVVILTFYFQVMSVGGGLVISAALTDIPFIAQIQGIFSVLGMYEIFISLVKSLVFGIIIASASCYHGLRVSHSITEIPQVTSFAVMQSLSLVFVADGIITLVSLI